MRTKEIIVYQFEELNEEAKQHAIESVRNSYYQHNDFVEWAIDDCYLLNPPCEQLEVLGWDVKSTDILIENTRKLYFDLDGRRSIDISNAMVITDDDIFLQWLGVPKNLIPEVHYTIKKDTIEFEENAPYDYEFTDEDAKILEEAKNNFEQHCTNILDRLEEEIDYRFSDGAIIEEIIANEREYLEDGTQY